MKFTLNQKQAVFLERENRFVGRVEIETEAGTQECKVHIPNTGRCKELLYPGNLVVLEDREKVERKYKYELILVNKNGKWISIDSQLPNKLAADAISNGIVKELQGYSTIKREHTEGNSRFDILLTNGLGEKCFVEVKGVTLEKDQLAMFPDAPTERGRKHIEELIRLKEEGHRAAVLFVIQMEEVVSFRPYHENDIDFANALHRAELAGVEILAYKCKVSREEVKIIESVPHFFLESYE